MQTKILDIEFIWVPQHLGGHHAAPYAGMRIQLRWQRYVAEWLERLRDMECLSVTFDVRTGLGKGTFAFLSSDPLPEERLRAGEPVELMNADRVLGVGRVVDSRPPS